MMQQSIRQWVMAYLENRTMIFLEHERVFALFVEAVTEVYGWGDLIAHDRRLKTLDDGLIQVIADDIPIDLDFMLTSSDWAIIKPLADLLVEKETALLLEASRNHGLEQHGRSSGEIEAAIENYRESLQKKAFFMDAITIN